MSTHVHPKWSVGKANIDSSSYILPKMLSEEGAVGTLNPKP